jgi:hypothetical protein
MSIGRACYRTLVSTLPQLDFGPRRSRIDADFRRRAAPLAVPLAGFEDVQTAARHFVGGIVADPPSMSREHVVRRSHNVSVLTELGGRRYFCKLYGSPWNWMREVIVTRFLDEAQLLEANPAVAAGWIDVTAEQVLCFSIFLPLDRVPLPRSPDVGGEAAFRDLGRFARTLHELPMTVDAGVGTGVSDARPFFIRQSNLFDISPLLDSGLFPDTLLDEVDVLCTRHLHAAGDLGRALVHNDLGTVHNTLAMSGSPAQLRNVVDFEVAHIGFKTVDFLWIFADAPTCFDAFVAGYQWEGLTQVLPVIRLMAAISALLDDIGHTFLDQPPLIGGSEPFPSAAVMGERVRTSTRTTSVFERLSELKR